MDEWLSSKSSMVHAYKQLHREEVRLSECLQLACQSLAARQKCQLFVMVPALTVRKRHFFIHNTIYPPIIHWWFWLSAPRRLPSLLDWSTCIYSSAFAKPFTTLVTYSHSHTHLHWLQKLQCKLPPVQQELKPFTVCTYVVVNIEFCCVVFFLVAHVLLFTGSSTGCYLYPILILCVCWLSYILYFVRLKLWLSPWPNC